MEWSDGDEDRELRRGGSAGEGGGRGRRRTYPCDGAETEDIEEKDDGDDDREGQLGPDEVEVGADFRHCSRRKRVSNGPRAPSSEKGIHGGRYRPR